MDRDIEVCKKQALVLAGTLYPVAEKYKDATSITEIPVEIDVLVNLKIEG